MEDNYVIHTVEETNKNLVHNVIHSDIDRAYYEEGGHSAIKIGTNDIWFDEDKIPQSVKDCVFSSDGILYYTVNTSNIPILKKCDVELAKINSKTFYSSELKDIYFIRDYGYEIIDGSGEKLPFGINKTVINSTSGYVSFTEGYPEGYQAPFRIKFYKYVGRKLASGLLHSDGSVKMADDYKPLDDKAIATKDYVDNRINEINDYFSKVVPPKPESFKDKSLIVNTPTMQLYNVLSNTLYNHVIKVNDTIELSLPISYNPEKGLINCYVMSNKDINPSSLFSLSCGETIKVNGNSPLVEVTYDGDYYAETLASKGFYKGFGLKIKFNPSDRFLSFEDIYQIKLWLEYTGVGESYSSAETLIGLENVEDTHVVGNINYSTEEESIISYVSGVPSLKANSELIFNGLNVIELKNYKTNKKLFEFSVFDKTFEYLPEATYNKLKPVVPFNQKVTIPENYSSEDIKIKLNTFNILNEESYSYEKTFNFRVDTISDESNRKIIINDNIEDFDSTKSLLTDYEDQLQLLNGQYQWPINDYSKINTYESYADFLRNGPDYSKCSIDGERFTILQYEISDCNGVWLELINPENISQNKYTGVLDFSTLDIKVINHTGWLNALEPYDGLGINSEDGQGCLVAGKYDGKSIYCTFGPKPIKGTLLIKVGIRYGDKKFSGFNIKENI